MRSLLCFLLIGCGTSTFTSADGSTSDATTSDASSEAGSDAGPLRCTGMWGPVTSLGMINMSNTDTLSARFSYDGLSVVLAVRTGATADLYVASRATVKDMFGSLMAISGVNTPAADETFPSLVGNELFFARGDATGTGLLVALGPNFTNAMPVKPELAVPGMHYSTPYVLPFGKVMYFTKADAPAAIMRMERVDATWGTPSPLNLGNGLATSPAVTPDETRIYFGSDRGGNLDVWLATRSRTSDAWGAPVKVPELSSGDEEVPTWVALDDCTIVLQRRATGNYGIYYAARSN